MAPRDEVLRTGEVTLKQGGKLYSATYEVLKGGIVRLQGKTGHLGEITEDQLARQLLREAIESGAAESRGPVTPEDMSDDIDIALAVLVLDLEADLVAFDADLQRRDPSEHPDHWTRVAPRLWSKVFQLSPHWLDAFPAPAELALVLRGIGSPREAAIHILARARATVSQRPESFDAESASLERNVERFLATPEGQERKAHIDRRSTT
jgi:hypothetical protein